MMKKISFLIAISFIVFSCTKDNSIDDLRGDKMGTESYYSMSGDGGGDGGTSTGGGDGSGQGGGDQIDPGQITAGEWSDLENWSFWEELENGQEYSEMDTYWEYNLGNRISVKITNSSADPAVDIKVELLDKNDEILWVSRTDNFGTAELWPYLANTEAVEIGDLKIRANGETFGSVETYSNAVNVLVLENEPGQSGTKRIDIAFMVDATGSMADELEYLKVELVDVIEKVRNDNPDADLNMGSVFYRDEGDEYVTRKREFSTDTNKTIAFINDQHASGGGDFPEAVHTAMRTCLKDLQWSDRATNRILFMLLDAPPHYEAQIVDEIHSLTELSASKGIKIIPITASGIDKETEFLMRYMAIATNGTYVFITDHSGIGGDHLEPSIGEYEVEYLNELMIRLINKYLE